MEGTTPDTLLRDHYVLMAKLAEQAERYDEMRSWMNSVATLHHELSHEERNLLLVSYSNSVSSRKSAFRTICKLDLEYREDTMDNNYKTQLVKQYPHVEFLYYNDIVQSLRTSAFKLKATFYHC